MTSSAAPKRIGRHDPLTAPLQPHGGNRRPGKPAHLDLADLAAWNERQDRARAAYYRLPSSSSRVVGERS